MESPWFRRRPRMETEAPFYSRQSAIHHWLYVVRPWPMLPHGESSRLQGVTPWPRRLEQQQARTYTLRVPFRRVNHLVSRQEVMDRSVTIRRHPRHPGCHPSCYHLPGAAGPAIIAYATKPVNPIGSLMALSRSCVAARPTTLPPCAAPRPMRKTIERAPRLLR